MSQPCAASPWGPTVSHSASPLVSEETDQLRGARMAGRPIARHDLSWRQDRPLRMVDVDTLEQLRLGAELAASTADGGWVRVRDNHFVEGLSFGLPVFACIAAASPLPLIAQLLVDAPETLAVSYVKAGASAVIVHEESCPQWPRLAEEIRAADGLPGIAVNDLDGVEAAREHLRPGELILVNNYDFARGDSVVVDGVRLGAVADSAADGIDFLIITHHGEESS